MADRQQLEQAIAVQETLRGVVDDAIVVATIAALRQQLDQLQAADTIVSQRKLATVLFMDIAEHTNLIQHLDPEDIMELVDGALQRLATPIARHGGQIVRYQGDGFKAVFGLPAAQERDPDHAIRAGLAIVDLAAEIAAEWQQRGLPGFNVRVGIDSGLVLAGGGTEGQDAVTGLPVNLAARLESAAAPGTVLISHHTYQHVRGVFDLEPLPPIVAKGFTEPVPVYRVLRPKARSFRTRRRGVEGIETRMVGREEELQQLRDAFDTDYTQRQVSMITVVGEAGLGKSRLLSEFENWVDLQPANVRLFRGRARPETQRLPFGLLRDIFAFRFDIHDDDSTQVVRDKLVAGFRAAADDANTGEMHAHLVGHLLGYDFSDSPHVRPLLDNARRLRGQALSFLTGYFQSLAVESPLLVLLEDIHWADDSSLDVLPGFVQAMADRPVLVVAAARPDLYIRRPDWLAEYDWHKRLPLQLLTEPSSAELLAELLQKTAAVPDSLRDLVVSRAEGNPFYVEELVKMLIEDGVIVKDEPHWRVVPEKLAAATVPPTLTGILQARLDGLPPDEKTALQRASVVGRLFWDAAVDYMDVLTESPSAGATSVVKHHVWRDLGSREFIYSRDETAFEGAQEYVFTHALLRDVTYETVLKRLRQRYHQRTAEWLIATAGARADEYAELIAGHYERAGNAAAEAKWQERAGKQAAARFANAEALLALGRALELTPLDDLTRRFDLLLQREAILYLQGERTRQLADIEDMQEIARELADPVRLGEATLKKSAYLHVIGDYNGAVHAGQAAAEWAGAAGEPSLQAAVELRLGSIYMHLGEYERAIAHLQRALEFCRACDSPRVEMESLRLLGVIAEELGNFAEELHYFERALELAVATHDKWGERRALNSLGVVTYSLGEYSQARRYYEQSLALAHELGDRLGEVTVLGNMGTLAGTIGDYERAEVLYREALQIAEMIDDRTGQSTNLLNLGAVAAALNRPAEALAIYEEARNLTEAIGDRPIEGYVLSGQAFALLANGRLVEAASTFEQAVALREELGQIHLAVESRAGLAAALLAQGDLPGALAQVERVMDHLATDMLERSEEYFRVLLICYEVLQAAGDERAVSMLNRAYGELQETAAPLDEQSRRMLLENIPWNRAIVAAWQAQQ